MATDLAMEVICKAVFNFRFPELVEKEGISMYETEHVLLGITHAECDGEQAVHWDLPGKVQTAKTDHHSPAETTQHKRLTTMVHIGVCTMRIGKTGSVCSVLAKYGRDHRSAGCDR